MKTCLLLSKTSQSCNTDATLSSPPTVPSTLFRVKQPTKHTIIGRNGRLVDTAHKIVVRGSSRVLGSLLRTLEHALCVRHDEHTVARFGCIDTSLSHLSYMLSHTQRPECEWPVGWSFRPVRKPVESAQQGRLGAHYKSFWTLQLRKKVSHPTPPLSRTIGQCPQLAIAALGLCYSAHCVRLMQNVWGRG
jgi:hypothetical protein